VQHRQDDPGIEEPEEEPALPGVIEGQIFEPGIAAAAQERDAEELRAALVDGTELLQLLEEFAGLLVRAMRVHRVEGLQGPRHEEPHQRGLTPLPPHS
jgi:hypothetical protein